MAKRTTNPGQTRARPANQEVANDCQPGSYHFIITLHQSPSLGIGRTFSVS